MRHTAVVILIGCATLAMFFETSMAETLCPYCVCLPSYSPVCGKGKETGKLRGFSSRCVLECTNKCRKNKYEFFYNGRCGKAPTTSTSTESTSTDSKLPELPGAEEQEQQRLNETVHEDSDQDGTTTVASTN